MGHHLYQVMLHQVDASPVLLSLHQFIEMDINYIQPSVGSSSTIRAQFSNVKLTAKEFIQVNHPLKPCLVGKEAIKNAELCKIDCFERALVNITGCKYVVFDFKINANRILLKLFLLQITLHENRPCSIL